MEIRRSGPDDIPAILAIAARAQREAPFYEPGMIRGQIAAFAQGQFIALHDGDPVGFAATLRVREAAALRPHDWIEITGGGYAAAHDDRGDWLYGVDLAALPGAGRLRVAERLDAARKELAADLGLKGLVVAARSPGLARCGASGADIERYFEGVAAGEIKDPAARFYLRGGFEPVMMLSGYRPIAAQAGGKDLGGKDLGGKDLGGKDLGGKGLGGKGLGGKGARVNGAGGASAGDKPAEAAALMRWRAPGEAADHSGPAVRRPAPQTVRVVAVQLAMRAARDLDDLMERVGRFIEVASSYDADFVVFPEHFAMSLLAGRAARAAPREAMRQLADVTPDLVGRLSEAARRQRVNVIGGSLATRTPTGAIRNTSHVCLRDGSVIAQDKIHPTPDEREIWRLEGGDRVEAFETDCGPAGILICYDSEFPELARRVCDQGARLLFAPYATDSRAGHLRVKLCCQARAIENQVYVVTAGNVGNLPDVENMDVNYAQSGVYTPCDHAFARDGVAAEASENVEMIAMADLDVAALTWARSYGSVRNFRDRRFDLYRVDWRR